MRKMQADPRMHEWVYACVRARVRVRVLTMAARLTE